MILTEGHPCYPDGINIPIEIEGNPQIIGSPSIAIVGMRDASPTARQCASRIAKYLADHKINVVSGYAIGIDTAAHIGALDAKGTTTLVLASGINKLYRRSDMRQYSWKHNICAASQFSPNAVWSARNAYARNKLIVQLARAVIVVASGIPQKGKGSGTWNTAQITQSLRKPLFVVSPDIIRAPGNKALLEQGATSLENRACLSQLLEL